MAETSETVKGLSVDEMKLLSDFSNVVTSREFTKQVKIKKLVLSYEETAGFTIELTETPLVSTQPEVVPT
ncbi:hypothetical protein VBApiPXC38_38 [Acinetobacter phage VB_ApiP_XC38]|uniref:Uncharacterized protein n=1 Tax=Acinetobacter phage VB_ApiP_XC38 TaxID=2655002 RepID=A0A5P8PR41_9CAUD|nr:hypothetical protein KNU81_gp38 [Acinetobacter phage VB_ApiP_XC38]QFR59725.1 hypothetical protein VBApiPXC38_38 [Acinetobacter phage VB_ApiP_XC38]